jgi:hypothetical protein
MNIRKIAVVGGFAVGAAVAFAPLAAADPAALAPVDPLISVVGSEESLLNSLFVSDAALAGDSAYVIAPTATNPFDIINPLDVNLVQDSGTTPFDYLVYGVNPTLAGLASDPGSYNVFNGALTEFSDAYNVEAYALLNGGALMPDSVAVTDLIGSTTTIDNALDLGTATQAFDYFWNFGVGDLSGFLQVPLTFLDIPIP